MKYIKNNVIDEKISDSEMIIYDPDKEEVHILNETSSEIYSLLDSFCLENELTQHYVNLHLDESYEERTVTVDELVVDAKNTLALFLELGIVKIGGNNE